MSETLKKILGTVCAGMAMALGQALGELARDAIKERWAPPKPAPKKRSRR